jgi:hypothetical protein
MATIKSYTDIEQSKKLADILPLESVDMWYSYYGNSEYNPAIAYKGEQWFLCQIRNSLHSDIPCWSLAALLSVIPKPDLVQNSDGTWLVHSWVNSYPWSVGGYSNPVDACVSMIEKLHELNSL